MSAHVAARGSTEQALPPSPTPSSPVRPFVRPSVRPIIRRRRRRPNIRRSRAKFAFQKVSSSFGRQEAHTHGAGTDGRSVGRSVGLFSSPSVAGAKCIIASVTMDAEDAATAASAAGAQGHSHSVPEVNFVLFLCIVFSRISPVTDTIDNRDCMVFAWCSSTGCLTLFQRSNRYAAYDPNSTILSSKTWLCKNVDRVLKTASEHSFMTHDDHFSAEMTLTCFDRRR